MTPTQEFLTLFISFLIIILILVEKMTQKKKEERTATTEEGMIIRWKDGDAKWNFISKERNMVIGWGKVKVWNDGVIEYIKDSNRERLYREEPLYPFNPYMPSSWRLMKSFEKRGHKIFWADGTDKYSSPKTFKVMMEGENE